MLGGLSVTESALLRRHERLECLVKCASLCCENKCSRIIRIRTFGFLSKEEAKISSWERLGLWGETQQTWRALCSLRSGEAEVDDLPPLKEGDRKGVVFSLWQDLNEYLGPVWFRKEERQDLSWLEWFLRGWSNSSERPPVLARRNFQSNNRTTMWIGYRVLRQVWEGKSGQISVKTQKISEKNLPPLIYIHTKQDLEQVSNEKLRG